MSRTEGKSRRKETIVSSITKVISWVLRGHSPALHISECGPPCSARGEGKVPGLSRKGCDGHQDLGSGRGHSESPGVTPPQPSAASTCLTAST